MGGAVVESRSYGLANLYCDRYDIEAQDSDYGSTHGI